MALAIESYRLARSFPAHEDYGLTSQVRRAAVSVPANIAEGNGRLQARAYVNHLWIARGSLQELQSDLLLAIKLGYLQPAVAAKAMGLCEEVSRMLTALTRSIRR